MYLTGEELRMIDRVRKSMESGMITRKTAISIIANFLEIYEHEAERLL